MKPDISKMEAEAGKKQANFDGVTKKKKNNRLGCFSLETEFSERFFRRNGWFSQNSRIKFGHWTVANGLHIKHRLKSSHLHICG